MFGDIAGVDVDKDNNVIIFHRGSHRWEEHTFDLNDVYLPDKNSPIAEETVITIDPIKKEITRGWGRNLFFMPHGLSLDSEAQNVWLTDVAMHQVFKYTIDGSTELMALGTPFVPGSDESHFCKPTSVADTGNFIFVADGYCNSRIVMFSAQGKYLGEFGQSSSESYLERSSQPIFNIPHKITYAKEAKMLCVADRENGRIQCFSFEPKKPNSNEADETGMILNGAIKLKFVIEDPLFNGRLFSLDYSPIRGGIIVAVSGQGLYKSNKPPLGFVYNVTTGQLLSRFAPPNGTFGMAHDLAITGNEAESLYVVDIRPVNLWKFSRAAMMNKSARGTGIGNIVSINNISRAMSMMKSKEQGLGMFWYLVMFSFIGTLLVLVFKSKKNGRHSGSDSFASLYSNGYPTSINSLFGGNTRFSRRTTCGRHGAFFSTVFSRRPFFSLFDRNQQQQSEFSRIPLEESDNSDDDKSDSDVEEFNINQASPSVKISV